MRFINNSDFDIELVFLVNDAWKTHPLKDYADIDTLLDVSVMIEDRGKISIDTSIDYPVVILSINHGDFQRNQDICTRNILYHEFSHLIDQHNKNFMQGLSIGKFNSKKQSLKNETEFSIKKSFITFWNAYIDGRLERFGIRVHSFNDRLEELIGTFNYKIHPNEDVIKKYRKPLISAWKSKSLTSQDLFRLGEKYPYKRCY